MATERLYDIPGRHHAYATVESVAAADATEKHVLFVAPTKCRVKAVRVIPRAAVTGRNTDTKHLNIQDEGAGGSGNTEIANLDLTTGVNLNSLARNNISVALDTAMAEGDVLSVEYEQIGTGLLIPICQYEIEFESDPN